MTDHKRPAPNTVQVPVHWLLRTIALVTGLVFLAFGSLSLVACMGLPAPVGTFDVIAHVIVVGIIVGMTLLGAFLVWIGLRRSRRMIVPAAAVAGQPANDPSLPAQTRDFGALIAQCGPQQAGLTNYLLWGAALLVVAALGGIAPFTFLVPKPGDEAAVKGFCWLMGGLCALGGLGMMWKPLFGQNQTILLYERGLIERVGAIQFAVALDQIEQLRVQEWYDHRFAPRTYNVRAKVRGERELSFSSAPARRIRPDHRLSHRACRPDGDGSVSGVECRPAPRFPRAARRADQACRSRRSVLS